jgi:hypothetical protein
MRMLATGQNCLPAAGIGAVATQLAGRLAPGSLVTGAAAARGGRVPGACMGPGAPAS